MGLLLAFTAALWAEAAIVSQDVRDAVRVEVVTVTVGGHAAMPVVVLKEVSSTRALPIFIGPFEARAIWQELSDETPPRPFTHDLMKSLLDASKLTMERVVITEVKENTYYAKLHLRQHGRALTIDSRPSDAIALALRCDKPILVARQLMHSTESFDLADRGEPVQFSGLTLQELTPELAARLEASGTAGVLVADVRGGRFEGHLKRGDILMTVGGERLQDALDAAMKLRRIKKSAPVKLTVRREGEKLKLSVPPGN